MPRKSRVEDDHGAIQVEVMIPVRQSGRAKVLEKARGPAAVSTAPKPPRIPRVTRLMALAIKLQDMIDRGEVRDYSDIATLGYVTRARVSQIMNLLLLAPDIQEQLLSCEARASVNERMLRDVCAQVAWAQQRDRWESLFSVREESANRQTRIASPPE